MRSLIGTGIGSAIDDAAARLAAAGVGSPRVDAEELAAHAAGTIRGRLGLIDSVADDFFERFATLVAARSRRVPLQHITGTAAFGPVDLRVGPGVFIPRPETESIFEWATRQSLPRQPVIVDACTGSGALAVALARHWPAARVIGIENSADALHYARQNVAGTGVELRDADVTDRRLFPDLDTAVDLLVSNPPYLPLGAQLEPEVAQHDPPSALFAGVDGMPVIEAVIALAWRWLRPGGVFAVEHDDLASPRVVGRVQDTGSFDTVCAHRDLAGRPRFVTARRMTP